MTKSGIFKFVGLVALVLLAVVAYRLLGPALSVALSAIWHWPT